MVQRPHYYAVVDEADSVLIDDRLAHLLSFPVRVESSDHQEFDAVKPIVDRLVNAQKSLLCHAFTTRSGGTSQIR